MRPRKGRSRVVPYIEKKLFPLFAKKIKIKKLKKKFYFWKILIFLKKNLFLEKNSILRKIFFYFWKKHIFNNLMIWQFPRYVDNLRGMGIFHWNEASKFGSSKRTRGPSLASFLFLGQEPSTLREVKIAMDILAQKLE